MSKFLLTLFLISRIQPRIVRPHSKVAHSVGEVWLPPALIIEVMYVAWRVKVDAADTFVL